MEVSRIAARCRRWVHLRCIAGLSPGPLYEALARTHLRASGFRILSTNFRIQHLEGDILARDPQGRLGVYEVRGRAQARYRARHTLSLEKERCLDRLVEATRRHYREQVRLYLVEVTAVLPESWVWRALFRVGVVFRFPRGVRISVLAWDH